MKAKAAILTHQNAPLEIWEIEVPALKAGQVLVKIAYSGFCHSQLNEIKGLKGPDPYLPHTLGHEGSGVVLECGADVTKVKPGDPVVLSWIKGTGQDVPGCSYSYQGRSVNSGAISTFLTHAVISENRVIPIPCEMPLKEAALLGCAIPTGAGVVKNEMDLKKGDSFAVFGTGGLGLSAILAARHAMADPIIAVDIHEGKLAKAKACGATHTVNASTSDPVAAIMEITQKRGVDFALEAAGRSKVMEQAFCSLKAPGGLCVLAGNLPKGEQISIDPFELIRGKRIVGTWGGKTQIDKDVDYYVQLYLNKAIDLSGLITHEVELEEINQLIEQLEGGLVARGLIHFR